MIKVPLSPNYPKDNPTRYIVYVKKLPTNKQSLYDFELKDRLVRVTSTPSKNQYKKWKRRNKYFLEFNRSQSNHNICIWNKELEC